MTTGLVKAGHRLPQPQLPASLARLTDDPTDHEGRALPWCPPAKLPERREVQRAISELRAYLVAATDRQVSECLARLALVTRAKDGSANEWKARAAEYIRQLHGFPADIWSEVCDGWTAESPFFPAISELRARLEAGLSLRQRRIKRLENMLAQPAPNNDNEPKESRHVRLRAIVESWRGLPDNSLAKSVLGASAKRSEIELAQIEGREPESWAVG